MERASTNKFKMLFDSIAEKSHVDSFNALFSDKPP
jgi:hypothetical protein